MTIDIRLLKHFDAVFRLRSFVKAAEEQSVTQSAITKSIKLLETKLGDVVFDRTTNRVTPTDTGERLIVYARDVIASLHVFEQQSARIHNVETGCINIGSGPYPLQKLLTEAIRSFSKNHRFVQIVIHTGSPNVLLSKLIARQLDMVISDISKFETMSFFDQIAIHALPVEPLMIIHRKGHPISQSPATMEEMISYPWALPKSSPHFSRLVSAVTNNDLRAYPFPQYLVEVPSVCIELVQNSDVLTSVPKSHALDICRDPSFAMSTLPPAFQTNDGIHVLKNKTLGPAAKEFHKHIEKIAQQR
jgi:DNA-binding transcriptional LysR family regulator